MDGPKTYTAGQGPAGAYGFLRGGGEMGRHLRAHDWAGTAPGHPGAWPQSLRTAVRLMLNSGHPMFIFWGPDLTCFYNDAFLPSLGPERHPDAIGAPGRQVWAEIWEQIGPEVEQVMAGGPPVWHRNALVPMTRHGQVEDIYWTYSYSPIDDEAAPNGVGGVLVVCSETTQEVQSARRTTEEMERLATLFEQAPGFMAVLRGPSHIFERVNPSYMQLIGDRAIRGRPVCEAVPEAAAQGYLELLDRVFRTGEPYTALGARLVVMAGPSGMARERFIDFVYQPIRDATGAITGIFVEGADVTARTAADAALRRSEARLIVANEDLEAKIRTRTHALMIAEETLRQSQRLEAVGQLTGGVAHDFNNLLTGILGSLELLKKRIAQGRIAEADRYINAAMGAASRAAVLTHRLLAFSGRQALAPRRADVNEIISHLSRSLQETVGQDITLRIEPGAHLWPTLIDPAQLQAALLGLSQNARDAMPGGGTLRLCTGNIALDEAAAAGANLPRGDYIWIRVIDTGIGMSPEVAARAFDPFFTTKSPGLGTGLGLAIIYGFVRQSGGQVQMTTAPLQGTTLEILLPRCEEKEDVPS